MAQLFSVWTSCWLNDIPVSHSEVLQLYISKEMILNLETGID